MLACDKLCSKYIIAFDRYWDLEKQASEADLKCLNCCSVPIANCLTMHIML